MAKVKFNLKRHIYHQIVGKLKMPDDKVAKVLFKSYFAYVWYYADVLLELHSIEGEDKTSVFHNHTKSGKPLTVYFKEEW